MTFVQIGEFDWLSGRQKGSIFVKMFKNLLLRNHMGDEAETWFTGLFQKKITFLVRKFQKFCVWFLTLYAFIICQVIIRPQYYINASLISAPVLILYQNVRRT